MPDKGERRNMDIYTTGTHPELDFGTLIRLTEDILTDHTDNIKAAHETIWEKVDRLHDPDVTLCAFGPGCPMPHFVNDPGEQFEDPDCTGCGEAVRTPNVIADELYCSDCYNAYHNLTEEG